MSDDPGRDASEESAPPANPVEAPPCVHSVASAPAVATLAEPAPSQVPALLLVAFLGLCLLAGMVSLVTGPRTPAREASKEEEVEILDDSPFASLAFTPEGVALVHVHGVIAFPQEFYGSPSAADHTVATLQKLRKLSSVKAVVLRINSPGGTVAASEEIHRQILELRKAGKKVVVSMADMAASGGYYIAAPADWIFANGGTITGSIGVITQLPRYQQVAEKIGIDFVSITSGPHKDMGNPFRRMTEAEEQLFRTTVMNAYLQFVDVVAAGRHRAVWQRREEPVDGRAWESSVARMRSGEDRRPFEDEEQGKAGEEKSEEGVSGDASEGTTSVSGEAEAPTTSTTGSAEPAPPTIASLPALVPEEARRRVAELADGRIYLGLEALRLGLVDEIGTLQDALDKAGELSGLGKNPRILKPKGPNEIQRLLRMMNAGAPRTPLEHLLGGFGRMLGLDPVVASEVSPMPGAPLPVAYLWSGWR